MNKDNTDINNTEKPAELSTGKKLLVKGWQSFTGLCSKVSGTPITSEAMGKKMLWGIGSGLLGHFSGMSFIGCLVTALTGAVFNKNIQGMGSSLMDMFQGKIGFANKSVLGPLLGGAVGFGVSAFLLHGGFFPSLLTGIGTASATDFFLGNQKERAERAQKALGLPNDIQQKYGQENNSSPDKRQIHQGLRQADKLEQRQSSHLAVNGNQLSDQELLAMIHSSPNGLEAIKNQFPDISAYNDFITRTGLAEKASQESMSRFEGKPLIAQQASGQSNHTNSHEIGVIINR